MPLTIAALRPSVLLEAELLSVKRCLDEVSANDPVAFAVEAAEVAAAEACFVSRDEAGEVLGVAWRFADAGAWRPGDTGPWRLGLQVVPRARRQGVGQSLLAHITNVPGPFVARCDVAHTRARRFLTHRAFELVGLVMHQRWDGGPEDVPRRFASGLIVEAKTDADFSSARELLLTAALEAGPLAMRRGSVMAPAWVLIASRGGRPVGVSVARRDREGWSIDSLAISSDARGLGIGRQLLCTLMERAAEEGQGVCLCLSPEYPRVLDFTSRLGFWTYRTSADFRRGSRSPTVATDTGYGDAPTT